MSELTCPFHDVELPPPDENGDMPCPECGRVWFLTSGDSSLQSRPQRVRLAKEIEEGARYDATVEVAPWECPGCGGRVLIPNSVENHQRGCLPWLRGRVELLTASNARWRHEARSAQETLAETLKLTMEKNAEVEGLKAGNAELKANLDRALEDEDIAVREMTDRGSEVLELRALLREGAEMIDGVVELWLPWPNTSKMLTEWARKAREAGRAAGEE